jgi:Uma2 family endonuclease
MPANTTILTPPALPGQRMSLEAFLALPEGPPYFELIGGVLHARYQSLDTKVYESMSHPIPAHQRLVSKLHYLLFHFLVSHPLGEVFLAPLGCQLSPGNLFQPDLFFILTNRIGIVGKKGIEGAPDLVVEILSPTTARHDLNKKMPIYAQAGVRELWLVDLDARTLTRHDNLGGTWQLSATLTSAEASLTSGVLPGLLVVNGDVFPTAG